MTDQLALHGGEPAKQSTYTLSNRYGEEEIVELRKVLATDEEARIPAAGRKV